jgi:hypothetical protein
LLPSVTIKLSSCSDLCKQNVIFRHWNEESGAQKLSITIFGIVNVGRKYFLSSFSLEEENR